MVISKCLKSCTVLLILVLSLNAKAQELPKGIGNFSFSVSYGLNYHLDGNKTIYWVPYLGKYIANNSVSFEASYRVSPKLTLSAFYEHFQGLYTDESRFPRRDLIIFRLGHHLGFSASMPQTLTERLSLIPRLGFTGRKGYEEYNYMVVTCRLIKTVPLLDLGINLGLSLDYRLSNKFSVFALAEYTRFVLLKSSETDELGFYDGPTHNYIRTRLGIQYYLGNLK